MTEARARQRWGLAQVRVPTDELRRWHEAAQRADLRLAQAIRRSMRVFVREQLEQPTREGD